MKASGLSDHDISRLRSLLTSALSDDEPATSVLHALVEPARQSDRWESHVMRALNDQILLPGNLSAASAMQRKQCQASATRGGDPCTMPAIAVARSHVLRLCAVHAIAEIEPP